MPDQIADIAEVIYYTEDSASPLTVLKPAAFMPGQVLLFVITQEATGGTSLDLTGPVTGWTSSGNYSDIPGGSAGKVWQHVYDAADPSSWDFGYNVGASLAAVLVRIVNADTTPLVVVSSRAGGNVAGSLDSPTVTPTGINDLLLAVISNTCNSNPFSETDPSGMNDRGQAQLLNLYAALALASQQLTNGNSTGAKTWTAILPADHAGGSFSIAIKSSGFLDPDPPPNPAPPLVPPWLLRELVSAEQRRFIGHYGTPIIKQKLQGGASTSNVTLVTDAKTEVDDILVVFHGNNFYTAAQLLTPTGTAGTWNNDTTGDNGTNSAHMKVWSRKVTVAGAQTVTCAPAVDEEHTVQLFVISGADTTTWIDVAGSGSGAASTSHVAPSVDPPSLNGLLLVGAQSTTLGNYTIPSTFGMTKQNEVDVGGFCTAGTASEVLGNDNLTGTRTFTLTTSGAYATCSVVIRAAGTVAITSSTNAPAENVSLSIVTDDAIPSIGQTAENVTLSAAALDATVVTGVNVLAESANLTTVTQDTSSIVAPVPTEATAATTATAQDAPSSITVNAECATLTSSALDATVSTAVFVNAPAEAVTLSVVVQDTSTALAVVVNEAQSTTLAQDVVPSVAPIPVEAPATVVTQNAASSIGALPTETQSSIAALNITPLVNPVPIEAPISAAALDATVLTGSNTNAQAELVSVTVTAQDTTTSVSVAAGVASASIIAQDVGTSIAITASVSTLTTTGLDSSSNVQVNASTTTLSLMTNDTSSWVSVSAVLALQVLQALDALAVTIVFGWPLTIGIPSLTQLVAVGIPTTTKIVGSNQPTDSKIVNVGDPY